MLTVGPIPPFLHAMRESVFPIGAVAVRAAKANQQLSSSHLADRPIYPAIPPLGAAIACPSAKISPSRTTAVAPFTMRAARTAAGGGGAALPSGQMIFRKLIACPRRGEPAAPRAQLRSSYCLLLSCKSLASRRTRQKCATDRRLATDRTLGVHLAYYPSGQPLMFARERRCRDYAAALILD